MNIEKALAIPGWMDEVELTYLAQLAEKSTQIAEVGTWRGRSARALIDNTSGSLTCIDTWADNAYGDVFPGDPPDLCQHPDWLWKEFEKNLSDQLSRIRCWRMTSLAGAQKAQSEGLKFDAIFIDGGHNYTDLRDDILAWKPLLAPNGILCGHDLYPNGPFWPGVLQAVNELIGMGNYRVVGTIWTTDLEDSHA